MTKLLILVNLFYLSQSYTKNLECDYYFRFHRYKRNKQSPINDIIGNLGIFPSPQNRHSLFTVKINEEVQLDEIHNCNKCIDFMQTEEFFKLVVGKKTGYFSGADGIKIGPAHFYNVNAMIYIKKKGEDIYCHREAVDMEQDHMPFFYPYHELRKDLLKRLKNAYPKYTLDMLAEHIHLYFKTNSDITFNKAFKDISKLL